MDMVITARDKKALEETKTLITSQAPAISTHIIAGDMGDMDSLPSLCSQLLELVDTTKHKQAVLINNAGTMNDFKTPFISQNDPKTIQDYFGVNFTSMVVLTTRFLSAFSTGHRYVVNISSLLSTVQAPGFLLYSASRAARNSFMGTLGAEMPDVRQLTYTPGPCDTDMYRSIPKELSKFPHKVLTPQQSIQKLVGLLKTDQFENGSVVDYFDC